MFRQVLGSDVPKVLPPLRTAMDRELRVPFRVCRSGVEMQEMEEAEFTITLSSSYNVITVGPSL